MAGEIGSLLGIAHGLASLTYVCGVLMQTLPVPKSEWKAWGPSMLWDAVISEIAIGTISTVQLLVSAISNILGTSFGGPFISLALSFTSIISQLVVIDATLLFLISLVSSTVVLGPIAEILAKMLGPLATWVTIAIIIWSIIYIIISFFPSLWLTIYSVGVCFFAIPFRIGRGLATNLMALAIVLAIGLPPMPSIALWIEGYIGYQTFLGQLQAALNQVQTNPLAIFQLSSMPSLIGNIGASVAIALILFPLAYLFMLSIIARSLAHLLGGSATGVTVSKFILTPAREIGREFV